jgi:hypothetical protein
MHKIHLDGGEPLVRSVLSRLRGVSGCRRGAWQACRRDAGVAVGARTGSLRALELLELLELYGAV